VAQKEEFAGLIHLATGLVPNRLVNKTIHAMKNAIILGTALSIVALMLISCSSEPDTTSTTTRQTTVTTQVPPPASQTTTTTTHHMGGGY
jgi:hypothetical protein